MTPVHDTLLTMPPAPLPTHVPHPVATNGATGACAFAPPPPPASHSTRTMELCLCLPFPTSRAPSTAPSSLHAVSHPRPPDAMDACMAMKPDCRPISFTTPSPLRALPASTCTA